MQFDEKSAKVPMAQKISDKWRDLPRLVKVVVGLAAPTITGIFMLGNTYLQYCLGKAPTEKATLPSNSNNGFVEYLQQQNTGTINNFVISEPRFDKPNSVVHGSNNTVININNPTIANQGPQLDSSKIELGERYAYAFNHFKGAMNELGNESRIIKPGDTLKKRYDPNQTVRITPSISNGNKGMSLEEVLLQMVFLDHGLIVERGGGWQTEVVNQRYSFYFAQGINNTPMNTDPSIFVKFPGTGKYKIIGYIDGSGIEEIEVPFTIELHE